MSMKKSNMVSRHYRKKRYKREKLIEKYLGGDGNVVDSFIVDRGHANGDEIHEIRDNGLIIIFNRNTKKLVSKLIARPQQIKRYYNTNGREPPKEIENILHLAELHERLGYNHI